MKCGGAGGRAEEVLKVIPRPVPPAGLGVQVDEREADGPARGVTRMGSLVLSKRLTGAA